MYTGRLNFVGRSGTALDVRYSAHPQGDQPEQHTKSVIQLYGMVNSDEFKPHGTEFELGVVWHLILVADIFLSLFFFSLKARLHIT